MNCKQTPMYWSNGVYGSKIDHQTDRDLDHWIREQYIKHHSDKSGAFSVAESTEGKKKHESKNSKG